MYTEDLETSGRDIECGKGIGELPNGVCGFLKDPTDTIHSSKESTTEPM